MPEVHLVVGVCLIAANLAAGVWGGYSWLERRPSAGFWYALRIAQATVILQTLLGLLLVFSGHHASDLHILYGVLPLVVSLLAEVVRLGRPLRSSATSTSTRCPRSARRRSRWRSSAGTPGSWRPPAW